MLSRFIEMLFAFAAALFFILAAFKIFQMLDIFSYPILPTTITPLTPIGFLDHWQTLAAGMLALVGAWWTVKGIRRQIEQAEKLETQRNIREGRAARAVLPLALSKLVQYSTDCINLFNHCLMANLNTVHQIPQGLTAPRIPEGILEQLQACARFGDAEIASQIWELLAWLQIQHSRLGSLVHRIDGHDKKTMILGAEIFDSILDAVELNVKCSNLFPYSRGSQPRINQSFQDQLESTLFTSVGIVVVDSPALPEFIKIRAPYKLNEDSTDKRAQETI
jgi:hypothetical protein